MLPTHPSKEIETGQNCQKYNHIRALEVDQRQTIIMKHLFYGKIARTLGKNGRNL